MLFTIWIMFRNINRIYFFLFCIKILRAIVTLFFSNFFQSSFSDGKFIPSQLYLFIKGLIFVILCGSFFISLPCNVTVTVYRKHLLSFLLIGFIVAFFVFYLIRRIYIWSTTFGNLFYDIYNTITEHNQRQTHYLSSILLGYSSVDSVLFYHHYFCIEYNRYFKVS